MSPRASLRGLVLFAATLPAACGTTTATVDASPAPDAGPPSEMAISSDAGPPDAGGFEAGSLPPTPPLLEISAPPMNAAVALRGDANLSVDVEYALAGVLIAPKGMCAGSADCGHIALTIDGPACNPPGGSWNAEGATNPVHAAFATCLSPTGRHTVALALLHDDESPFYDASGKPLTSSVAFTTTTAAGVASIKLTAPAATLAVGSSMTLVATTLDAAGNTLLDVPVVFLSSAPAALTVDAKGVVTGVMTGAATVTASSGVAISTPVSLSIVAPQVTVTQLSPSQGPVTTVVTLTGIGFGGTPGTVTFGAAGATIDAWTQSSIQAEVPTSLAAGMVNVTVTRADQMASGPQTFTVTSTPVVSSTAPNPVPPGTAATLSISGYNLMGTTGVQLYQGMTVDMSSASLKVTSVTPTQVVAAMAAPGAMAGQRTVVVATSANGNSTTAATPTNQIVFMNRTGSIVTVAGTGTAGFSGERAPALTAQWSGPRGLHMSGQLVFVADTGNSCVRAFNTGPLPVPMVDGSQLAAGTVGTIAGVCGKSGSSGDGASATQALLKSPVAVRYDASRNLLFVADLADHRIRVVNQSAGPATIGTLTLQSGQIGTFLGTGIAGASANGTPAGSAQLSSPEDVSLDGANVLWIADTGNSLVRAVFTGSVAAPVFAGVTLTAFQIFTVAGNGQSGNPVAGPALQSPLAQPCSARRVNQSLYIADRAAKQILVVNTDTQAIAVANASVTVAPAALAILTGGKGGATNDPGLKNPTQLVLDPAGGILVADPLAEQVIDVSAGVNAIYRGGVNVAAGAAAPVVGTGKPGYTGDYGPMSQATLHEPRGLALDPATLSSLYIADSVNNVIRKATLFYGGAQFTGELGDLVITTGEATLSPDTGALTKADSTIIAQYPVTDGVFNFGSINIAAGATLIIASSTSRAFLLASKTAAVNGTITLTKGVLSVSPMSTPQAGGGWLQPQNLPPGQCQYSGAQTLLITATTGYGFATAGTGSTGSFNNCCTPSSGTCTFAPSPIYGDPTLAAMSGGVGGTGALVLAAQGDVDVEGTINADGVQYNTWNFPLQHFIACGGSTGGGVKVVSLAGNVTIGGNITANGAGGGGGGGGLGCCGCCGSSQSSCGTSGQGRIRLEAAKAVRTAGATMIPAPSIASASAPVLRSY